MKRLKFTPDLCQLILDGSKTTTWRYNDDKDIIVGDTLELINSQTLTKIGEATIVSVHYSKLGVLSDRDWQGHEKFNSKPEMYSMYKTYYPQAQIDENSEIKVIKFDFRPANSSL